MRWLIYDVGYFFTATAKSLASASKEDVLIARRDGGCWDLLQFRNGSQVSHTTSHQTWESLLSFRDVLVIWNGIRDDLSSYVEAARKVGMPVAHMEIGYWPSRTQLDPDGVNVSSLAASAGPDVWESTPVAPDIWSHSFRQRPLEFTPKIEALPGDEQPLPKDYLFWPLQLDLDTQILFYSPWVPSMKDCLSLLSPNVLSALSLSLVAKEHPSSRERDRGVALEMEASRPEVVWARHRTAQDLIENSRAVVTINSSVGLQALCARKKVIVLGRALWARPEWCLMPKNAEELAWVAREGLAQFEPDWDACGRFMTWLRDSWHVSWNYPALIQRIRGIASGERLW
jgi:capsular polysaccharide export protein